MSVPHPAVVVLITAPDEATAAEIARALVGERLAACAGLLPGMRSIYCWKGEVRDERETLLVVKTREDLFEPLARRVRELHPYEVPEVISLPIVQGLPEYLSWLDGETSI